MRAGIALGSNLGDRQAHLRSAWRAVQALPGVGRPVRCSPVYETAPIGMAPGAGAVLNAVAELEYAGPPAALLEALLSVEKELGRPSRRPRNASRAIDLDLLYAGNLVLTTDDLVLPHPRLQQREFVLRPLSDLAPDLRLPGFERTIAELLDALPPGDVRLRPEYTLA